MPPRELLATWPARVGAAVLDNAVVAAVSFLAVGPVDPPALPGLPPTTPDAPGVSALATSTQSWWVALAVVTMLLLQAFTGATPGKLVVGLAVVRESDGRPAGVLTTILRLVARLLDLACWIGLLRPLWHPQRKTFADSLVGTVVLRTRRPLRYRPRITPRGHPPEAASTDVVVGPSPWEGAAASWRPTATAVAGAACAVGLVLTWGPAEVLRADSQPEPCWIDPDYATRGWSEEAFVLMAGQLGATGGTTVVRRLGIERSATSDDLRVTEVGWDWAGSAPEGDVLLRARFTPPDGSRGAEVRATLAGGRLVAEQDGVVGESHQTVTLPDEVADRIGPGWEWEVGGTAPDGTDLGTCARTLPD